MTQGNFNWFLHAMLFNHTQRMIKKQQLKMEQEAREKNDTSDSDSDSDSSDIE